VYNYSRINKERKVINILIICDTARIGGVERLALDQAYELNKTSKESTATILVLNSPPTSIDTSFIRNENELIKKLKIDIFYAPGSKLKQFFVLKNLLRDYNHNYVFTCSMRAGMLSWLVRIIYRFKFTIFNTIQQLPSLTSPNQHLKRVFYSQFSDRLFICCDAALKDWEYRRKKSLLIKFISRRRRVELCRNGIYLPRLSPAKSLDRFKDVKRFVYIGRLTAWKGLETFLKVAQLNEFKKIEVLLVTPTDPSSYLVNLEISLRSRIKTVVGKSISEIIFKEGDVHLYPASYGDNTFVEGISLNVLEMACLGIPSLVTKNGCATWPELHDLGFVYEVDWSKFNEIVQIVSRISIQSKNISQVRSIVDIKNSLNKMLSNN